MFSLAFDVECSISYAWSASKEQVSYYDRVGVCHLRFCYCFVTYSHSFFAAFNGNRHPGPQAAKHLINEKFTRVPNSVPALTERCRKNDERQPTPPFTYLPPPPNLRSTQNTKYERQGWSSLVLPKIYLVKSGTYRTEAANQNHRRNTRKSNRKTALQKPQQDHRGHAGEQPYTSQTRPK